MVWTLDKIDPELYSLRYNQSMITLFFFRDEIKDFLKFISEIDLSKIEVNITVVSELWSLNLGRLDNGQKIIELYSSEKGFAFIIFYDYFEPLINLSKEKLNELG